VGAEDLPSNTAWAVIGLMTKGRKVQEGVVGCHREGDISQFMTFNATARVPENS
jgi:hypothetical protein